VLARKSQLPGDGTHPLPRLLEGSRPWHPPASGT
jgi:hypothetical protein